MDVAFWIIGLLVVIVVLVFAVGSALPLGHMASRTRSFPAQPQAIWDALHDPALARAAGGDVKTEEVESVPPKLLVTKIVGETAYGGTWTFEIGATDRGSELTITERGEVYNPAFRFISRFVMGHHRSIDAYMSQLRKRFGG